MWKAFDHWKGWVEVFDPLTAGAAALTAVGAGVSAMGTLAGGDASQTAGTANAAATRQAALANADSLEFKAKQEDMAAQESRASSQRDALERGRQTKLVLSKLQAGAAASGAGATDPTVTTLAGQIGGRGEYEALTDLFKGENRARGLMDSATGDRMSATAGLQGGELQANAQIAEGNAKKSASQLAAAGTIIGGAGSAFKAFAPTRYG